MSEDIKNQIVTQALAGLAFGVKERTVFNWINSWASAAKVYDNAQSNAALVDITLLAELLCQKNPEKYGNYNWQDVLATEQARAESQNFKAGGGSRAIKHQVIVNNEVKQDSEISETYKAGNNRHITPQNVSSVSGEDLIRQVSEAVNAAVKQLQPDHTLLSQTTALASRKSAEMEKYQQQITELSINRDKLSQEVQQLKDKRRGLHYCYLIIMLFFIAACVGIYWLLDKRADNYMDQANTFETKFQMLNEQLDNEIENARQEKELLQKTKQAEIAVVSEQLNTAQKELENARQLAQKDSQINQMAILDLQRKIEDIERSYKSLEQENLLLLEGQKDSTLDPNKAQDDNK